MNIAVLGAGGREHALVWRLRRDGHRVTAMPGSAGIGDCLPVDLNDDDAIVAALQQFRAELVVIGPEGPLARGLADVLRQHGLLVVGPGITGAQLEASKAFAKAFMVRHGVATARAVTVHGMGEALDALPQFAHGVVMKFDGLAAGKGVIVCDTVAEAEQAVRMLTSRHGNEATLVLEEKLRGREVSVLALVDGTTALVLPPAQDHKRLLDGDKGPNTGGMGAYCPVPWFTPAMLSEVRRLIIDPTLRGLQHDGIAFRGVIYFGVMVTAGGPKLLEYNARFGDPETQVVLPQIAGDFGELLHRTATAALAGAAVKTVHGFSVGVVLAAANYPDKPELGVPIQWDEQRVPLCFHAGTAEVGGHWHSNGGRVLTVVGRGDVFELAQSNAYAAVAQIDFPRHQHRSDIGKQALPRRAAILFSGRGSNLGALLAQAHTGCLAGLAEVVLAVTNVPAAGGLEVARHAGVPTLVLPSQGKPRAEFDAELVATLQRHRVQLVVLAGFMRILSPAVVAAFPRRIINIHPADTRAHQGLHGYEWAQAQGLAETLVTAHLVDAGLDTGPILAQATVDLRGARDIDEIVDRGLAVEHAMYGRAIADYVLENL